MPSSSAISAPRSASPTSRPARCCASKAFVAALAAQSIIRFSTTDPVVADQQQPRRERNAMSGSLDQLLRPKSIAIVGVSQDFNKLNGRPMKFLLEKGYQGKIFPVNPRYEAVGGVKCYQSIAEVQEPVALAAGPMPAERGRA